MYKIEFTLGQVYKITAKFCSTTCGTHIPTPKFLIRSGFLFVAATTMGLFEM